MRLGEHGQQRKLCDVQCFLRVCEPNVLIFHTKNMSRRVVWCLQSHLSVLVVLGALGSLKSPGSLKSLGSLGSLRSLGSPGPFSPRLGGFFRACSFTSAIHDQKNAGLEWTGVPTRTGLHL